MGVQFGVGLYVLVRGAIFFSLRALVRCGTCMGGEECVIVHAWLRMTPLLVGCEGHRSRRALCVGAAVRVSHSHAVLSGSGARTRASVVQQPCQCASVEVRLLSEPVRVFAVREWRPSTSSM